MRESFSPIQAGQFGFCSVDILENEWKQAEEATTFGVLVLAHGRAYRCTGSCGK